MQRIRVVKVARNNKALLLKFLKALESQLKAKGLLEPFRKGFEKGAKKKTAELQRKGYWVDYNPDSR
jgi:hypothetical protein